MWKRSSVGKIEQPCFLSNPPASLLDVSTGIIAGELWWADQEQLEIVHKAVG